MAISAFKALSECFFLMSATASPCGVDDGASTPFWTAVPLGVTLGTMASAGRSMGGGVSVGVDHVDGAPHPGGVVLRAAGVVLAVVEVHAGLVEVAGGVGRVGARVEVAGAVLAPLLLVVGRDRVGAVEDVPCDVVAHVDVDRVRPVGADELVVGHVDAAPGGVRAEHQHRSDADARDQGGYEHQSAEFGGHGTSSEHGGPPPSLRNRGQSIRG